jgi:hypothetical protein
MGAAPATIPTSCKSRSVTSWKFLSPDMLAGTYISYSSWVSFCQFCKHRMSCSFLGSDLFIPDNCVATLQEDMGIPTTCKSLTDLCILCSHLHCLVPKIIVDMFYTS